MKLPIATVILLAAQGYVLGEHSLAVEQGEYSPGAAYSQGCALLSALQIARGADVAEVAITKEEALPRTWELIAGEAIFLGFHSQSGALFRFGNPAFVYVTAGNRSPVQYPTEQSAHARAESIAAAVGKPSSATVESADYRPESATQPGRYMVRFSEVRLGRRVIGTGCTLELDVVTGLVYSLQQHWAYTVEAEVETLTQAQGIATATAAYEAALPEPARYPYDPAKPAVLAYVHPDEGWGATGYPIDEYPRRVRLAWHVPFGRDHVWIDAGSGALLGGHKSTIRP